MISVGGAKKSKQKEFFSIDEFALKSNAYNSGSSEYWARMFLLAASISSRGQSPCNAIWTSKRANN
jgi:hypothetical protein